MQSRKIKVRKGPQDGGTDAAHGESRRAGSPRQRLAVGLVVGTGLYATLFGGAAVAQAPAPADTTGASPPSSEPAPGGTDEADLLGIGSEAGGSDAAPDPGTPTDPAGETDPPPPTDPGPEAPAPASPEAPAPAGPAPDVPAAAAPATDATSGDAASHHDATTVTRSKATNDRTRRREPHTASKSHRHTDAHTEPAKPEHASPATDTPVAPDAPVAPAAGALAVNPPSSLLAPLGPLTIGVPNLSIDDFRIPPFLLPIYQAAGVKYGVSWEVLAAINEIETDYGRNLNVSSAGAVGWMQFMPSTWDRYGVDANRDGITDPNNPVDAIFAAGRYLRAAGAQTDLRRAILAYNHADWYADSVLSRASAIGSLPGDLIDSLSGLVQGRFPVAGGGTQAHAADAGARPDGVRIAGRAGAAVVAVNDGTIASVGHSHRLGRFVQLRDAHGNTYTYGHLTTVGKGHHTRLRAHARVNAGTTLGHVGRHLLFEIRPGGRGAPRIDPEPVLAGWKLLQATGMYRVPGSSHVLGRDGARRSLVMGRQALAAQVLDDPRVQIYDCGREDIRAGAIDRRVLATLEFLAASGFSPTVSALECGHSLMTASGNVSEHSTGTAVDIAAINGIPIAGHQGAGSITDTVVRRLLTLQGSMKPHQIITLMQFPGTDNTFAMADHADHIHIGWRALPGSSTSGGGQAGAVLKPKQWSKLVDRLGHIKTPKIAASPSKYAIKAIKRGPSGHPRVKVTKRSR